MNKFDSNKCFDIWSKWINRECIHHFGAGTKSYSKFENFGKIYNIIIWIDKWAAMFSFAFWNVHIFSVVQYVYWEFRAKYLEIGSGKREYKSIALIIIIRSEFPGLKMWHFVFKISGYSASRRKMGKCYALFRDLWLYKLKRIP